MAEARRVLDEELAALKGSYGEVSEEEFVNHWQKTFDELILVPSENRVKSLSRCTPAEKVAALEHQFTTIREKIKVDAKKAGALEKRLAVYHGGYVKRADTLEKSIAELQEEIQQAAIDLACFKTLQAQESLAIPQRIQDAEALVQIQLERERRLQKRYAELTAAQQKIFEKRVAAQQ